MLALRDDEGDLTVVLSAEPGDRARGDRAVRAGGAPREPTRRAASLDLQRVLETVCDTHEFESREDGAWVELTKRTATRGAA